MARSLFFFEADDSSSNQGLWVSDGTAAGTSQVGGLDSIGIAGASTTFDPSNITAFGNGVLFRALDSSGGLGLWYSDGTAAGTYEIGGAKDAGVSGVHASTGLNPTNIITFGTKALFFGWDSGNYTSSLWATDGTAAGTIELGGINNTGITGSYALGISPANFFVLGNRVLFSGLDTNDYRGLWITDGTTAGTVELSGVQGASLTGATTSTSISFSPTNFTLVGSKVVFAAADTSNAKAIWVTDGTTAGTFEIGGVKNASVSGASSGGLYGGSGFASLGSVAVFLGRDAQQVPAPSLWVTDGTLAGTSEVGGLNNAGVSNAWSHGLNPVDLTAFGNKAVFLGEDSAGGAARLWVTDGTAAGTIELGGIGNAGLTGLQSIGAGSEYFTAIGNKVVFEAKDSSGLSTLWVSDGTTAGTFELGGVNNAGISGAPAGGLRAVSFTVSGNTAMFEAFAQGSSAVLGLWVTDGTVAGTHAITGVGGALNPTLSDAASLAGVPPLNSVIGDLNGDGTADLVLQNGGTVVDWLLKGGTYQSGSVLTTGAAGYSVVAKGDLNGDGTTDLVLQNGGTVVDWLLKNGQYQSGSVITTGATGFSVVAAADINGDGTTDLILQNGGTVVDWIMKNGAYQSGGVLTTGATGYTVVGAGDLNGDGTMDLVLQNGGTVVDWLMKNGQYQSGSVITTGATGFTVKGVGDVNGDGTADIVLQNGGTVVDWIMKNGAFQSGNVITSGAAGYNVVGVGDYNGDGTADIALQSGGTVLDWIMKNGTYQSGNILTTGATGFSVV